MQYQTLQLLDLYRVAKTVFRDAYDKTQEVEKFVQSSQAPPNSLADYALLLKKTNDLLDNAQAECNKALGLIEKVACLQAAMAGKAGPIRGEIATATPKTGSAIPIPKRREDPEKFDAIHMYFGFSREACEKEIARLYYPSVEAHMQQLQASGKPLPECLKDMQLRPTFKLTCRCAPGVDLDELALSRERENDNGHGNSQTAAGEDIPF